MVKTIQLYYGAYCNPRLKSWALNDILQKKPLVILLLILSSSLLTFCKAQNEPGQIVISAGVGYSPEFDGGLGFDGTYYPVPTSIPNFNCDCDPYPIASFTPTTPNEGGTIDVGIIKWFSIGLAASYQGEVVYWAAESNGSGPSGPYPFSDKITRTNIALRFLYHLPLDRIHKHFDPYVGVRIGESLWTDIEFPNNIVPAGYYGGCFLKEPNLVVPSFQVLCGAHIYLIGNLGIHVEAGIGSPYLVEGGLTFRINTRKSSPQSSPQQTSKDIK